MVIKIKHPIGYEVDPVAGVVYGLRGGQIISHDHDGYLIVHSGSRNWKAMGHRIIWEAVHGPIPEGMQINHKNGKKGDNRIENLEVVTPQENTLHAYRIGLMSAKGEANGRAIGKKRRQAEIARSSA